MANCTNAENVHRWNHQFSTSLCKVECSVEQGAIINAPHAPRARWAKDTAFAHAQMGFQVECRVRRVERRSSQLTNLVSPGDYIGHGWLVGCGTRLGNCFGCLRFIFFTVTVFPTTSVKRRRAARHLKPRVSLWKISSLRVTRNWS